MIAGRRSAHGRPIGFLPWLLTAVVVAIGVVVGLSAAGGREDSYEGVALLEASALDVSTTSARGGGASSATLAAVTAAHVRRPDVVRSARSGHPTSTDAVEARVLSGTTVVEVSARSSSRAEAVATSRAYALALRRLQIAVDRDRAARAAASLRATAASLGRRTPPELTADIARLETAATRAVTLAFVRSGDVRERHPSPASWVVGLVGGLLAFALAVTAMVVRRWWRSRGRRISNLPELRRAGVPVVGVVPRLTAYLAKDGKRFGLTEDERELFRIARRGLHDLEADEAQVVLVTSAQAAAGKSTVASGIATVAAEAGSRVLLVECDLRLPSQAERLNVRSGPGLADYLAGDVEPRSTLQEVRVAQLGGGDSGSAGTPFWVVTAGGRGRGGSVDGERVDEMLRHLRRGYDLVVLDAPPLIGAVDSGHLLARSDAIVICARLGEITWDALDSAVGTATRGGGEGRVGIVATDVRRSQDPAGEAQVYGATKR